MVLDLDDSPLPAACERRTPMRWAPPHAHAPVSPTLAPAATLAWAALDLIDYPVLLVTAELQVLHANAAAEALRRAPDGPAPTLWLAARQLQLALAADRRRLQQRVDAAITRGLRSLVVLGDGAPDDPAIAVVPLSPAEAATEALLILPKPSLCETLTLDAFARQRALTPGEARVMRALCEGESPQCIAQHHGVALSTVRTQISALRAKTGMADLRALTRALARLPPLVHALGHVATAPTRAD